MIGWAATFLVIALIAGVLGFSGIAGAFHSKAHGANINTWPEAFVPDL